MKEHANIRTRSQRPPLPHRCSVGVGLQGGWLVARQVVLGPAAAPPVADLSATHTVGTRALGDVGALVWVAEQLDLVALIDRACGGIGAEGGPSVGELAVAVAIQRACSPGPKRDLGEFLDASLPRVSCLPGSAFTGQAFHRAAQQVTELDLEQAQVAIWKAAVAGFELSADVLAFDTTNFDTHIATLTPGELAKRGHAKSKRKDLRVVGLASWLARRGMCRCCIGPIAATARTSPRWRPASGDWRSCTRASTVARVGSAGAAHLCETAGFGAQLELELDAAATTAHLAATRTQGGGGGVANGAQRGAMNAVWQAQRGRARVCEPLWASWTYAGVVESQDCSRGKSAASRRPAQSQSGTAQARGADRQRTHHAQRLEDRVKKALAREHLSSFVVTTIAGTDKAPTCNGKSMPPSAAIWRRPAGPASAVHGSPQLEHRAHRVRLQGSMARRGVVSQSEERRRVSLGAVASMGRWIAKAAHLCHCAGLDAREPDKDRAHARRFGTSDAGEPGADQGHAGRTPPEARDEGHGDAGRSSPRAARAVKV